MNPTPENHKSMAVSVRERYLSSGFLETDCKIPNLLRFGNQFSEHFVFLFDSLEDLVENWQEEHSKLVLTYQEYTGPHDMEWNLYAIFLCEECSADTRIAASRRDIETDTSYSRKFVLALDEINSLPPGRITQEDFGKAKRKETNLVANWQGVLGDELFQALAESPKKAIHSLIKDYIGQRKDGN